MTHHSDVWWPGTLTQDKLDIYKQRIDSGQIVNQKCYIGVWSGQIRVEYDVVKDGDGGDSK